jgi:hypothetical protein|tara:strand:- start:570 stop:869 length:300 start_codon:yes stop_codon:yes gene_type:complete
MAAVYPTLPDLYRLTDAELIEAYSEMRQWADSLINELEGRDLENSRTGTVRINRQVSVGELGQANAGDIVYERKTGKFKGYVSVAGTTIGWSEFNSFTP